MIRATTPTHKFKLPFEAKLLKKVIISYGQNGNELLSKKEDECTFLENEIILKLTQEETKLFTGDIPVNIQLRALTNEGDVVASKKYTKDFESVMNDEVLE